MYLIIFLVPVPQVEVVKNAMFAKGAGKMGAYSSCAWQVLGEGQFMPLEGSDAFIGEKNKLERVPEYRVELVCDADCIEAVIQALKDSHPYEMPAYHVIRREF